jgi:hypothetical protein
MDWMMQQQEKRFGGLPSLLGWLIGLAALTMVTGIGPATAPTSRGSKSDADPAIAAIRATLRDVNDHIATKGATWAESFLLMTNDDDRQLGKALCQTSADLSLLYLAVQDRFGRPAVESVAHLFGDTTNTDINAAIVERDGDRAIVTYQSRPGPDHLVRVHGQWLVDIAADLDALSEHDRAAALATTKATGEIAAGSAKRIVDGQFDSLDQLITSLKGQLADLQ